MYLLCELQPMHFLLRSRQMYCFIKTSIDNFTLFQADKYTLFEFGLTLVTITKSLYPDLEQ